MTTNQFESLFANVLAKAQERLELQKEAAQYVGEVRDLESFLKEQTQKVGGLLMQVAIGGDELKAELDAAVRVVQDAIETMKASDLYADGLKVVAAKREIEKARKEAERKAEADRRAKEAAEAAAQVERQKLHNKELWDKFESGELNINGHSLKEEALIAANGINKSFDKEKGRKPSRAEWDDEANRRFLAILHKEGFHTGSNLANGFVRALKSYADQKREEHRNQNAPQVTQTTVAKDGVPESKPNSKPRNQNVRVDKRDQEAARLFR